METLNAPANPWPALVCAVIATLVWAGRWLRARVLRNRVSAQSEHERVTGWFGDLRKPGAGPAVLRDSTEQIVLSSLLVKGVKRGRHRMPVD